MSNPQYAKASYQSTDHITLAKRGPYACPDYVASLRELSRVAEQASQATTQAAYLFRFNRIRQIMKSLG